MAARRELRKTRGTVDDHHGKFGRTDMYPGEYVKVENNVPNLANEDIYLDLIVNNPAIADKNPGPGLPVKWNYDSVAASYKETRKQPLLIKPDTYKLAVAKLELPSSNIPIFNFVDNGYYISIIHATGDGGNPITEEVVLDYVPLYTPYNPNNPDRVIGNVSQFLQSVNTAMDTAYTNIVATYNAINASTSTTWLDDPTNPPNAPTMYYDSNTNKFYMRYDETWILSPNVELYFNTGLALKFEGFRFTEYELNFEQNQQEYRFVFQPSQPPTGVGDPQIQYEDGKSVETWYDIYKIILTTTTIPARGEYIGGTHDKFEDGTLVKGTNNSTGSIKILTEFTFDVFNPTNEMLIYTPEAEWRWIDLLSSIPLYNIDIAAYTYDQNGSVNPIMITPGRDMFVKLLFRKK